LIPSNPFALPALFAFATASAALESVGELASVCPAHALSRSVVGVGPADAFATRHVDADGVPAAPLPSVSFAEKSSDADDGCVPQLVPTLRLVGTPGVASAFEQVEAKVGSSAEPNPASEPANEPVPVAIAFARIPESSAEAFVRLASASADGPYVVGVGAEPSGADGSGCDDEAFSGALAVVPGPVAEAEPCEGVPGPVVFELVALTGSLVATVAGPAFPPSAKADPPTVELCASGRTSGCAETAGPSARARPPDTFRSAITAKISMSFLI
jgi:hypothetical protein